MLYIPRAVTRICSVCQTRTDYAHLKKSRGQRDGVACICLECHKQKSKARYYSLSRRDWRVKEAAYRDRNRVALNARQVRWMKADRAKDPEKYRRKQRQLYRRNPQKHLQRSREWHRQNPEVVRVLNKRRDALKREAAATFTVDNWKRCLDYWNGACAYCGRGPSYFDRHATLQQDHFVPLANQGGYTPGNILPACQSCNTSKSDREFTEWGAERWGAKHTKAILKRIQDYFEWVVKRE